MNKKFFLLAGGVVFIVLLVFLFISEIYPRMVGKNGEQLEFQILEQANIILPSDEAVLGQNFVVGIPGKTLDEETKKILEKIKPAGIILYYRNFETYDQFKGLITDLQQFAATTTGKPYFIMIDEEPGGATRLNLFKNVFDSGMPDWDQIERDIKEMAYLGINVDLAPLADFPFNEDAFIKERIPAHNPEALVDFNKKFIELLQKNHISGTLKHFPGMGVFVDDPHKKLPYVSTDKKILDESMSLFKNGIDAGVDFVMTVHGVYDDLDPNVPATLSKKITTDILQNNLGFKGLVITDDISDMPFIVGRKIDLAEAAAESLKAGHNLIIFSHEPNKLKETFDKLLQKTQNDTELKSVVEKNYQKVVFFKQKHSLSLAQ